MQMFLVRPTAVDRLLRESSLIKGIVQQAGPGYETWSLEVVTEFRRVTMRYITAKWLLNQPETSEGARERIIARLICDLRRFRRKHLAPLTQLAA
jgi:hypothetical protein